MDIATTVLFTDDPVIGGVTIAKGTHLLELRTAAEALRVVAGLAPFTYADAVTTELIMKATHISELRAAMGAARTQLGLSAMAFTDPSLAAGDSVKAVHCNELRGQEEGDERRRPSHRTPPRARHVFSQANWEPVIVWIPPIP